MYVLGNRRELLNSKTPEATSTRYAMDVASITDILRRDKAMAACLAKTTTRWKLAKTTTRWKLAFAPVRISVILLMDKRKKKLSQSIIGTERMSRVSRAVKIGMMCEVQMKIQMPTNAEYIDICCTIFYYFMYI